jgi:ketosteroid isomerase-like protein
MVDLANAPDQPAEVRGRTAIGEVCALWKEEFDDFRAEIDEYTEVGAFVICAARWRGEGKKSGISIDNRQYDVYEFKDGECVRATLGFDSKREAMEATGAAASSETKRKGRNQGM